MKILFVLLMAVLVPHFALAYELPETDGDDIPGNAPALLGWEEKELPLKWAVVEGNHPGSPVTTSSWFGAVQQSFTNWEELVTSKIAFQRANDNGATNGVISLVEPVTASCFSPVRSYNDGRQGPPYDDGLHNVVYCVTDNWVEDYGFSSAALAVTLFVFSTESRNIKGGDIFLNADTASGRWNILDPSAPDTSFYDVENTITHEIGHFIGLAHPWTAGRETSTMYYSASAGEVSKRELTADDINGANYLYPEPGVILIPPDTETQGLKDLSNPIGGGGCTVTTATSVASWQGWVLPWFAIGLGILVRKRSYC